MVGTTTPTAGAPDGVPVATVAAVVRLRRWRRRLWLAVAALGLLLAVGAVGSWLGAPGAVDNQRLDTGPRSGPAPGFSLADLADPGATVSLAYYRGRPVVVNFWASWCVPCRREMPQLAAAARRLDGRVAFVGINYKDERGDALALARETAVPYRSGFDGDGAVGARYGIYGMPTTVFVDAQGRIVGRYLGEMSEETLDRFLRQLAGT